MRVPLNDCSENAVAHGAMPPTIIPSAPSIASQYAAAWAANVAGSTEPRSAWCW
jgi:hypothetical protein